MSAAIALIGAGRMGRGLAVVFAYAGHDVALIDLKPREADQFARLAEEAHGEIAATLTMLARLGLFAATDAAAIAGRVRVVYERAYSRPPTDRETARALDFVRRCEETLAAEKLDEKEQRLRAWQSLCRVVLAANEFIYVE